MSKLWRKVISPLFASMTIIMLYADLYISAWSGDYIFFVGFLFVYFLVHLLAGPLDWYLIYRLYRKLRR